MAADDSWNEYKVSPPDVFMMNILIKCNEVFPQQPASVLLLHKAELCLLSHNTITINLI